MRGSTWTGFLLLLLGSLLLAGCGGGSGGGGGSGDDDSDSGDPGDADDADDNGDPGGDDGDNIAPQAAFTASTTTGVAPVTVTFNASGSSDPDGIIIQYHWNFGDGATAAGVSVTHTFNNPQQYTVVLTVTDDNSATATASEEITVTASGEDPDVNEAPVASFSVNPTVGSQAEAFAVDGRASTDPDGDPLSFSWNWGDGSSAGSGPTASHQYFSEGDFVITLTVTDPLGLQDTATQVITVVLDTGGGDDGGDNRAPVAGSSSPITASSPQISITPSFTDPDGDTLTYAWDVVAGEEAVLFGTPAANGTTSVRFARLGNYTLQVTATDPGGLSAHQDIQVAVEVADAFRIDGVLQRQINEVPQFDSGVLVSLQWQWLGDAVIDTTTTNPSGEFAFINLIGIIDHFKVVVPPSE